MKKSSLILKSSILIRKSFRTRLENCVETAFFPYRGLLDQIKPLFLRRFSLTLPFSKWKWQRKINLLLDVPNQERNISFSIFTKISYVNVTHNVSFLKGFIQKREFLGTIHSHFFIFKFLFIYLLLFSKNYYFG